MSDMRFKDFLSNQEPVETEQTTEEQAIETPVEAVEQEVAPSPEVLVTLEDRMRAKGFVIPDDIDPVDLYDQAIDRIAAGTQAMQEAQQLRLELERLKNQPAVPAAPIATQAPVATESPTERAERTFMELKEYDPAIAMYVERDESGRAVPKAAYGSMAVEAAKVINDYEQAERRQASLLLRNPNLLIQDNMSEFERLAEEKAQAIVEKRLSAWQEEQQRRQQEAAQMSAAEREQQALAEFHESNKSKLFQLDSSGNPLRMPFDQDQFSTTPTGRYFMQRYNELQGEMQGVPRLTLLNLAMREAELAVPPVQKQAVVETATPAEKRQKFVEQRNDAAVLPHQNTPPASGAEGVSGAPRLRFADMLRRMPENQDVLGSWT
jgi:hypothetical protein